jgi:hypothetical protein
MAHFPKKFAVVNTQYYFSLRRPIESAPLFSSLGPEQVDGGVKSSVNLCISISAACQSL